MVTRFSDTLSTHKAELSEFQVDDFLENLFWSDVEKIRIRVEELLKKAKWPIHKEFDFDDCLASRAITLKIKWFKNNRWNDGIIWLFAHYSKKIDQDDHQHITQNTKDIVSKMTDEEKTRAIDLFIEEEYTWEDALWLVKNVWKYFKDTHCTYSINTAGIYELQFAKLQALGLLAEYNIERYTIVDCANNKIKAAIIWILDMNQMPQEYIIHEDRPELFHKYGQVMAHVLHIPVTVKSIYINAKNEAAEKWSVTWKPTHTKISP